MSASEQPKLEPTQSESPDDPNVAANLNAPALAADETPAVAVAWLSPDKRVAKQDSANAGAAVQSIGPYRVERRLGQGGFGAVYLAMDEELHRRVAIKVPKRLAAAQVAEYREEAQKLAWLEHPGVVPIYTIGHTDEFPVFLVTKFIEGGTLAEWAQRERPDYLTVARVIAEVAEALHATHNKGIFHRDIKPANILMDAQGKPFLADFGLALKEGHGQDAAPEILGTPAYMSPEQAAGEGHRVDGQTDIFSLGVVLYELLAGMRPFRASEKLAPREQQSQLLENVKTLDPRPPRQINDQVPKELERICLKALAKRKPERYTIARDMADDLRHFVANPAAHEAASARIQVPPAREFATPPLTPTPGTATALGVGLPTPPQMISDREPLKIVPKGLRSFDAGDASFFLDLLPGPRDRDGLPESIRYWKTRIESRDAEVTFAAGVLYGPSGCGKSSLVKAGLIPHLANDIVPIYLEATGDDTEQRLSRAIRRACPAFGDDLSLTLLLKNLRRGVGLPSGKKALIVLDQFEQWLHAKRGQTNQELPAALRQCDGERVQCLILVRDDFWLAISHFLEELEIPLDQARNYAMADLFDPPHARKVLDAFGVAFGQVGWDSVPTNPPAGHRIAGQAGRDGVPTYNAFLDQSIAALTEEGKIISVRLALFAEMVKSKPWTPQTLQAIGGVEGVGVTFLEETFSASNAPMAYRAHQVAVRGVLKALLPEVGTDIKGHRISRDALLQASGYAQHPRDFESLLRILDRDLRLITPVDEDPGERGGISPPVDSSLDSNRGADAAPLAKTRAQYQLAHDYLVPSIRNWLTKKQRETRKGRAELRLEERAAIWNSKPLNRNLPAWWEHLNIRWFVPQISWTAKQRAMMRRSARVHGMRAMFGAMVLAVMVTSGLWLNARMTEQRQADRAEGLVNALAAAKIGDVSKLIEQLEPYRAWADPLLYARQRGSAEDSSERLNVSLALLPVDRDQVAFLKQRLLTCDPQSFPILRDALAEESKSGGLREELWSVLRGQQPSGERFRAAWGLATFDTADGKPDEAGWQAVAPFLASELLAACGKNPSHYEPLLNALRPVGGVLREPLANVFRDPAKPDGERRMAVNFLAEFVATRPDQLVDLLVDAEPAYFAVLFDKLSSQRDAAVEKLSKVLERTPPNDAENSDPRREVLAIRQARAAAALLRLDHSKTVWPLLQRLKDWDDPRRRSELIHAVKPLGVDPRLLARRLGLRPDQSSIQVGTESQPTETDPSARRALLLALGEWSVAGAEPVDPVTRDEKHSADAPFTAEEIEAMWPKLLETYRSDPDAGIHGASAWLLRQWGQKEKLLEIDRELAAKPADNENGSREWFINGQGQTLVTFRGPVEFLIGSPASEVDRIAGNEDQVRKRIGRSFQMSAYEVTVEQWQRHRKDLNYAADRSRESDAPWNAPQWYDAARYCNWLSEQEGIPKEQWCYDPDQKFQSGMTLPKDYLSRTGYRLPSEAEWELACRAGAVTSRYYGETATLLGRYAWYSKNSQDRWMLPIGSLKPNDRGLFDMQGNAFEWCQEAYGDYAEGDDVEDTQPLSNEQYRVLRGASFSVQPSGVRSCLRLNFAPSFRNFLFGFRVARTNN